MQAPGRGMRIALGVLGLTAATLVAAFVWWTDTPRARYAGMSCQYGVIFDRQGPVDAVILGTSRAQRGVDPTLLATELGMNPGSSGVVNLARGGRGHGQLHQMLLDLDEQRGIRGPIVLEYTPENDAFWLPRPLYYQETSNEGARLTFDSFADAWRAKPREPAYARVRDTLEYLRIRFDTGVESLLTGAWRRNPSRPEAERPPTRAEGCMTAAGVGQRPGHRRQLDRRERTVEREVGDLAAWNDLTPAPDDFDHVNQDRQHHYVAEAIAFAQERNLPIMVVAMPGYLQAPLDPDLPDRFEERFGVPLLLPPPEIQRRLDDRQLFQDAYHLNERGRSLFTDWLAREMARAAR